MKKYKIAISAICYPVCGTKYYAEAFRDLGHQVTVVGVPQGGFIPWQPETDFSQYAFTPDIPLNLGTFNNGAYEYHDKVDLDVDLAIQCDSGFFLMQDFDVPNVCIAIDNHVRSYQNRQFDYYFPAHSNGTLMDKPNSTWLPCAYSDRYFKDLNIDRKFDIVFIGVPYQERVEYINELSQWFPGKVLAGTGKLFDECNYYYNMGKIAFVRSAKNDLAQRIFENMASGSLVLADRVPDMEKIGLQDDNQLLIYDDLQDCLTKASWAINHWDESQQIVERGKSWVTNQTWKDRANKILEVVFG